MFLEKTSSLLRYYMAVKAQTDTFFNVSSDMLLIPLYSEIVRVLEVKDRAQPWLSVTRFVFQQEVCYFLK